LFRYFCGCRERAQADSDRKNQARWRGDFEKEFSNSETELPRLSNQTKAKGTLILEHPQSILKGGDTGSWGRSKKPKESLLLRASLAPGRGFGNAPSDNKVAAKGLKSRELGLIQLWIEQGATGEMRGMGPITWQALPPQSIRSTRGA